jgi:hypothetical protein
MDRELSEFLLTNPTRKELDAFIDFQDWRWGHLYWESGALHEIPAAQTVP